jgi:tetratricopeptide (TPR) repeat protein
MRYTFNILLLLASLAAVGTCRADEAEDIAGLQTRWAEVKYQLPEAQQEKAFALLAADAEALRKAHPSAPAYEVWEGIIRATYAGAKGGFGALGEAKRAKALFEEAIKHDPNASAAYTSLGSLYYQVPGWPVGFGDDRKAKELLQHGLQLDPDGIDANYFYGDYLLQDDDYQGALAALEKARLAAPRPGRESADAGRRAEIAEKIAEARRKM